MDDYSEEIGQNVPRVHAGDPVTAPVGRRAHSRRSPQWRRVLQVAVGVGVAAGVAVGATALASAASSGGTTPKSSAPKSPSKPSMHWRGAHLGGPGLAGPGMGLAFGFGGFGPVLHGEATVKGPNGYETIEVQTGTVTSLKDVSGSTWSLVVTSADKTALTYTVDSGTSVNGGESGISSVKTGNAVSIEAVVSNGTATAKTVIDTTTLKANRASWAFPRGAPMPPMRPATSSSGSSTT